METLNLKLQELLRKVSEHNKCGYGKIGIKSFNKKLYEKFKIDINKIKIKPITDLKEIKQFCKINQLESVDLILIHQNFNYAVLTNSTSKHKINTIGYYHYETVRIKKGFEDGNKLYIAYSDDEDEKKRVSEIRNKRYINKKDSYLDCNSIFYRDKKHYYGGSRDKSSYRKQIDKYYKIISKKFLDGSYEEILNYVTNKELMLYKEYQTARNIIFNSNQKDISVMSYSMPNFDYPLKSIREAFYKLKNKESIAKKLFEKYPNESYEEHLTDIEKWHTEEYNRYFMEIMQKAQDYKTEIQRMISLNYKYNNMSK